MKTTDRNRRFWKSQLGDNYALVDTSYVPRRAATAIRLRYCRTASHTKALQRNKAYNTPLFFNTTHIYNYITFEDT